MNTMSPVNPDPRDDNPNRDPRESQRNPDPITGTPGAHPVGTGVGAAVGGAAAGAAAGTVVGPVGTVVGAALGAVIGGLAGKGVAEVLDPTGEDAYWRSNFGDRPYVERGSSYDDYGPAYGFGVDAFNRHPGRAFDDIEPEMSQAWANGNGTSTLSWESARTAARDAWNRLNGSR